MTGPSIPDMVVLSLLAEQPMHGYALNQELVRREVRDWAGISRPQVYYSIRKLLEAGLLQVVAADSDAAGPEKQVVATSPAGKAALVDGLSEMWWARQREVPAFLTWLALSGNVDDARRRAVIAERRQYLVGELAKEQETLRAVEAEDGPLVIVGKLMIGLTIRRFEDEIAWLSEVEQALGLVRVCADAP